MRLLLATIILTGSTLVMAQASSEITPAKPNKAEEPKATDGTIVKPTKTQLKTIPAAPPARPAETKIETKKEEAIVTNESAVETKNSHLFGLHADVNFPHVLNYGVDYWSASRCFSAAINFGGYSQGGVGKSNTDTGMDLAISNQELDLKYHPFLSKFYVGAMYGQHKLVGQKTATYAAVGTTTITDTVTANYITPHLGFTWKADWGLTIGMDLGWLVPINTKTNIDDGDIKNQPSYATLQAQPDYIENKRKLQEESDKYGKTSLPYLALIRVGWLF
ncbi:MAG: hypothetical protein H7061_13460 [Bdellovibrionaceae bacterium]|nr:hypothetical protein [Bdellovibrio sp.]